VIGSFWGDMPYVVGIANLVIGLLYRSYGV